MRVENDDRVYFAKKGYYKGKEVTITHRDPKSGDLWLEDFPVGKNPVMYGVWVSAESVNYKTENGNNHNRKSVKTQKAKK